MHRNTTPFAVAITIAVILIPGLALAEGTQAFDRGMQPILKAYLAIHNTLAHDKTAGIQGKARQIAKAARTLDAASVTGEHASHYQNLPATLRKAAETLATKKKLGALREAFKGLSRPMALWGTMSRPKDIVVAFCSMAKGSWLQKKGAIRNPYYGASMLSCGEVVGGDSDTPSDDHSTKQAKTPHGDMPHGH